MRALVMVMQFRQAMKFEFGPDTSPRGQTSWWHTVALGPTPETMVLLTESASSREPSPNWYDFSSSDSGPDATHFPFAITRRTSGVRRLHAP